MSSEPYAIPPKDRAFEGILWYIKHYDLQGGDRLPAERVLCEELGVSRTALRAAITRLISCGTLESRRGSGTYVCPPKPLNIFQETWNWLKKVGCTEYVNTLLINQYAMSVARQIQCEQAISEYGFLAKHPTTGAACQSPYVSMLQQFTKQANQSWYQIYQIVKENCSIEYMGATP